MLMVTLCFLSISSMPSFAIHTLRASKPFVRSDRHMHHDVSPSRSSDPSQAKPDAADTMLNVSIKKKSNTQCKPINAISNADASYNPPFAMRTNTRMGKVIGYRLGVSSSAGKTGYTRARLLKTVGVIGKARLLLCRCGGGCGLGFGFGMPMKSRCW